MTVRERWWASIACAGLAAALAGTCTPDAELRLITCGDAFDAATSHYLSNIVGYATEAS